MDSLLRRLSVRFRIVGSFLIIGLLILVAIPFIATNFNTLINRLEQVITVDTRADRLLSLAATRIASSQVNLIRYIQDYTPSPAEALDDVAQAVDLLEEAKGLAVTEEQVETLDLLIQSLGDYDGLIADITEARVAQESQAVTRLQFQANRLGNDIGIRIELLVKESEMRLLESNDALAREARLRLIYIIGGSAGVLVFTMLTTLLISRSITRQVEELRDGADMLRKGRRDVSIPVRGNDELSALARTFNQLTAELSKSYLELEQRVTDRTRALAQRALELQTAAEVAREAATIRELQVLMDEAVELIRERFGLYHASIFLLDDQREYAVLRSSTGEAGRALLNKGFKLKVGAVGIVGFVARSGEQRVVNNVEADYSYYRDPLLPDTRSELAVPLKVAGQTAGVLDVQSAQVNAFTEDFSAVLMVMADLLAVAIQNALLVEDLQSSLEEVRSLYARFAQESWQSAVSGQRIGYEYDQVVLKALEGGLPAEVLAGLKSVQVVESKERSSKKKKEAGAKATVLAPLKVYDQIIGVLGIERDDPHRAWGPEELALIEAVSTQVALALDNARLLEETQLRTDQLRLLQEITATAISTVSLNELLQGVAEKMRTGFDLLHCGILLFDQERKEGRLVADASMPDAPGSDLIGVVVPLEGNELTQEVIRTQKATVVYDAQNNPRNQAARALAVERGTNTLVVVPLLLRGEVIGTIGLDVADLERKFTEDDLRLLNQISLQISASIEVTRTIEQTALRAERERQVAEIAARMRETLDVESVMNTAADEIYRRLNLEEVSVFLVPEGAAPRGDRTKPENLSRQSRDEA